MAKILPGSSDEFGTPQALFDELDREFHFTLDAAASDENHKCDRYFTKEMNALEQPWKDEVVWCNPPYSRGNVEAFVRKAVYEACDGATVVMLLPCRTEQRWFHEEVLRYGEVRFLRGRVQFEGGATSARFPSMIVIFRPSTLTWTVI